MAKKCRPCKPCHKRRGSPRFSATCKTKFRECMRGELRSTGSMRSAGRTCMTIIQQCQAGHGHTRALKRKTKSAKKPHAPSYARPSAWRR